MWEKKLSSVKMSAKCFEDDKCLVWSLLGATRSLLSICFVWTWKTHRIDNQKDNPGQCVHLWARKLSNLCSCKCHSCDTHLNFVENKIIFNELQKGIQSSIYSIMILNYKLLNYSDKNKVRVNIIRWKPKIKLNQFNLVQN